MNIVPLSGTGPALYPLQGYFFSNGLSEDLYVVAAHEDFADFIGKKITAIDGHSIEDTILAIDPLLGRDNLTHLKAIRIAIYMFPNLLDAIGMVDDPAIVQFQLEDSEGNLETVSRPPLNAADAFSWFIMPPTSRLITLPVDESVRYLKRRDEPYWDEFLEENGTLYIQYNEVNDMNTSTGESLQDFVDRLRDSMAMTPVERTVLDLRLNGGGDNTVFGPLVEFLKLPEVDRPDKLFVIIGRATLSAAGNLAAEIDEQTGAVFVGERTGGSPNQYGDNDRNCFLPHSGHQLLVPTIHHNQSTNNALYTEPLIETPLTYQDYSNGIDPAMEAILALIGETTP